MKCVFVDEMGHEYKGLTKNPTDEADGEMPVDCNHTYVTTITKADIRRTLNFDTNFGDNNNEQETCFEEKDSYGDDHGHVKLQG